MGFAVGAEELRMQVTDVLLFKVTIVSSRDEESSTRSPIKDWANLDSREPPPDLLRLVYSSC